MERGEVHTKCGLVGKKIKTTLWWRDVTCPDCSTEWS
jgi:hypothetical protein